jgi:hypothetical protein
MVAKHAERLGWVAWPFRKAKTYCPKCRGPSASNDPDSELRKVKNMATPVAPIKQPTPDQRLAIRGHLDKSFDDNAGMYLDGMSDQRVAELVGVPRVCVESIRELAYGPIKVDPVIAGLRAEIADIKRSITTAQSSLDQLNKRAMEVSSRIEKMTVGRAA